jgi:hypothetical protein
MRWAALIAAVLVAAGLGVAVGFVLDDHAPTRAPSASPTPPALVVTSRRTWSDGETRLLVETGSLGADPMRGFVLYHEADRWIDQHTGKETERFVNAEPRFFTSADRSGPLRIVASSRWSWVLQSSGGVRSVLERDTAEGPPSYYVLGKRLDPAHLPRMARHGLAVPVVYGPTKTRAVVLIGHQTNGAWTAYGYLDGFSVPRASSVSGMLRRPLRRPGDGLFSVDPLARRLVRVHSAGGPAPKPGADIPPRCSTWHGEDGRTYETCPDRIAIVRPSGSTVTLARYAAPHYVESRWTFLSVSPSGRTLLLEHDIYACGTSRQAFLLSLHDGALRPAFDSSYQSEPVGWLPGGVALVAGQELADCEGSPISGLYSVWPEVPDLAPQLVVATSAQDATGWAPGD